MKFYDVATGVSLQSDSGKWLLVLKENVDDADKSRLQQRIGDGVAVALDIVDFRKLVMVLLWH